MAQHIALLVLISLAAGASVRAEASDRASETSRALLQQPTTTSCVSDIPSCRQGRCINRDVAGKEVKVCLSCKTGYRPSKDGKHCVCPAGLYERCDTNGQNCACVDCGVAFYCPGGQMDAGNKAPTAARGQRFSCHQGGINSADTTASVQNQGLTTLRNRSRSHTDCVPMPGYRLDVATRVGQAAAQCTGATYSPGMRRIRACFKCQSGLIADPSLNVTSLRTDMLTVCKIPPGRFLSQNLVRPCPTGRYREGIAGVEEVAGRQCIKCSSGLTTAGPGANSSEECTYAEAGFQLTSDMVNTDASPDLCPIGFYFPGGLIDLDTLTSTCLPCPGGTSTRATGSASVDDCLVPPGYYVKGDTIAKCPTNLTKDGISQGFFRAGWAQYEEPSVREGPGGDGSSACSPCGAGVLSELTDVDVLGGGDNPAPENGSTITTSRVATSQQSCYILPGQGLSIDGDTGKLKAEDCPEATYGAPGNWTAGERIYGPSAVPCKPCPRFMTSPVRSTSYDACINTGGYSYIVSGSTVSSAICADGTYNEEGSLSPCKACPNGRTTKPNAVAADMESINDCYVAPGFGLFFSNSSTPWIKPDSAVVPTDTIPEDDSIKVKECPPGYYGPGGVALNTLNSLCIKCEAGSSAASGSTQAADCNAACEPGFGLISGTCTICPVGSYADGTSTSCQQCRNTLFVYESSRGTEESITLTGTTLQQGATTRQHCVATASQLFSDAGTSYNLGDLGSWTTIPGARSMSQCMLECESGTCCFAQLQYDGVNASGNCSVMSLAPAADATGTLLYYKLVPSDAIAAFSKNKVSTLMSFSTTYQACTSPEWEAAAADGTSKVGATLEGAEDVKTGVTPGRCQADCDKKAGCWGFFYSSDGGGKCLLRSGESVTNMRSFFVMPEKNAACSTGQFRNVEAAGACTACPANSQGDGKRTTCTCNKGYTSNGTTGAGLVCSICNSCACGACYSRQNAVADSCASVEGGGFTCSCQAGQVWDATTNSCIGACFVRISKSAFAPNNVLLYITLHEVELFTRDGMRYNASQLTAKLSSTWSMLTADRCINGINGAFLNNAIGWTGDGSWDACNSGDADAAQGGAGPTLTIRHPCAMGLSMGRVYNWRNPGVASGLYQNAEFIRYMQLDAFNLEVSNTPYYTYQFPDTPWTAHGYYDVPVNGTCPPKTCQIQIRPTTVTTEFKYITLAEVGVYSRNGSQYAPSALNFTMSPTYATHPVGKCNDGITTGTWGTNSLCHTTADTNPWLRIRFPCNTGVSRVMVYYRADFLQQVLWVRNAITKLSMDVQMNGDTVFTYVFPIARAQLTYDIRPNTAGLTFAGC